VTNTAAFVSGLMAAGYLMIGVFFLRFWRQSADSLFGIFAISFGILAVQRALLTMLPHDEGIWILLYGMRAFAFLLIVYAIIIKNRKA
jgi:hypothetical protein